MKWRMMLKIDDNFFVRFWPHNVRHQLSKDKTMFKLHLAWKSNKKFQNENLIFSCEMNNDVENWWQFFVRFWPHNVRHQLSKVKTLFKLRLAWKSNKKIQNENLIFSREIKKIDDNFFCENAITEMLSGILGIVKVWYYFVSNSHYNVIIS